MSAFLEVATQLTAVLVRAHHSQLIHGDVCATNIRVDPRSFEVALIAGECAEPF